MGQSLKKFVPGSHERKIKEIGPIIDRYYDEHLKKKGKEMSFGDFYHEICLTVQEINTRLDNTQFQIPTAKTLEKVYSKHNKEMMGKELKKDKYQEILKEVIAELSFTGIGAKESLFYIFGVPVAALLVKQGVMPRAIPNEFFIPGVTSLTVLVLAAFNKI